VLNPWPIIGGVANVVCDENEYVKVNQGKPGDILILTKPIGTQVAVNLNEWLIEKNEKWTEKSSKLFSEERAKEAYYMAVESMSVLNLGAA
jgi:selenide,water dikinase